MAYYCGKIVDAHQHVNWLGKGEKFLAGNLDLNRINYGWLLTWESIDAEALALFQGTLNPANALPGGGHRGIALSDGLRFKERYPDRAVLGYCPSPLEGDASGLLKAAKEMYNVQVCGEWKFRIAVDDPRCINLFRTAGALKMPVVIHLDVPYRRDMNGAPMYDDRWYGGTVDNLERALQACPQTVFLGHGPGFWREISKKTDNARGVYPNGKVVAPGKVHTLLKKYKNLYADMSAGSCLNALKRDPGHARRFLPAFADRLLFARDNIDGNLFEFLDSLKLKPAVMEKICFRNAEKLVKPDLKCRWA